MYSGIWMISDIIHIQLYIRYQRSRDNEYTWITFRRTIIVQNRSL